jgi:CRP-like cAMP-binding protein
MFARSLDIPDRGPPTPQTMHVGGMVHPRQNHLLGALASSDMGQLAAHLEPIELTSGRVVHESGNRPHYVYFPTSSILSVHYVMEDGSSSEVASVGNEGILGVSVFMGGEAMPTRSLVQTAGYAYRLKSQLLLEVFDRGGTMRDMLLRYSHALITQIAQTGACNRHHAVEQQLCRWLLLTLDRQQTKDLVMTQEAIASMLGVRRESVTAAALKLKQLGLITYRRGYITVVDRLGLYAQVCECYDVVKAAFQRLQVHGKHQLVMLQGDLSRADNRFRATGRSSIAAIGEFNGVQGNGAETYRSEWDRGRKYAGIADGVAAKANGRSQEGGIG